MRFVIKSNGCIGIQAHIMIVISHEAVEWRCQDISHHANIFGMQVEISDDHLEFGSR
jgi:hypothetical protein